MTPLLQKMYSSDGGSEVCDTLMKYLYKGMAQGCGSGCYGTEHDSCVQGFTQMAWPELSAAAEGGGQSMSVLLSWHEKVDIRV